MHATVDLSVDVQTTGRVMQMAGLFDVPLADRAQFSVEHDLPVEKQPWNVGLITGPSGAGKSSLADVLWPGQVIRGEMEWEADQAILDAFPQSMGIKDITATLTSVGLGSAPSWMRPYRTLSTGEAFRATIARAVSEARASQQLVVVDEYTSVVDRQVAQVASHTVQKMVRRDGGQFVAVTCHYDIIDWLQPDWMYDVASREFTWRSVQPHPPIQLEIRKCDRALWGTFARHHYLSHKLHGTAICHAAYVDGRPVAFHAHRHYPHPRTKNIQLAHRLVVLPDWQGLGIASRLADFFGQYLWDQGYRYRFAVAHPGMIAMLGKSPRWKRMSKPAKGLSTSTAELGIRAQQLDPRSLGLVSFQYTPPRKDE
jgi:ABC-type lipoprotein export system ATPase subunit/GNAT superfamily N-acetyltransferase